MLIVWKGSTVRLSLAALCLVLGAVVAQAQTTTSTIAGTVKDTTSAVLPGVTVEASSPALIEKVRSTVSDATGLYKIADLRPGIYTVTFTLTGFSTVKREGIELTTGFTATVNADLKVGEINETITVSGATPVVDVQNTQQARVMTRDVVEAIPTGRNYANLGTLIPGITLTGVAKGTYQDVGGNVGNAYVNMAIHGGRTQDQMPQMQGMSFTMMTAGNGGFTWASASEVAFEETILATAAHAADQETGGVQVNLIPKSGGNTFKGTVFGTFGSEHLQSDNFSAALKLQGLQSVNRLKYFSDINPGIGGPIKRDKLWFYASYRSYRFSNYKPYFYAADPNARQYTPGPNVAEDRELTDATSTYVTWQVTPKNRLTGFYHWDERCDCDFAASLAQLPNAQEATRFNDKITQFTWTRPATNRLLFEAGLSWLHDYSTWIPYSYSVGPSVFDASTGLTYRAYPGGGTQGPIYDPQIANNVETHASVTYAARGHTIKVGVKVNPHWYHGYYRALGDDYTFTVVNGVCLNPPCAPVRPIAVTYLTTPYDVSSRLRDTALYGQDQWTARRLTVNAGLRFDWFKTSYPAGSQPAKRWVGPISWEGADVLSWKDLSPRLGASYDLFGNGKTALKVNLGRYVVQEANSYTINKHPYSQNRSITRSWADANGDFIPQGDPNTPAPNGELTGSSPNVNFGTTVPTVFYDPNWASGWGVRPADWELTAGVQHELVPRVSVNGTFIDRWYEKFTVTNNRALTATDFDPYCITAPSSARLPSGGGQQICGLFDLKPTKLGQINNIQTAASNYGNQSERWMGFDLGVNARLPGKVLLQGGLSTGKTTLDVCDIATKFPQITTTLAGYGSQLGTITSGPSFPTQFCHLETPFLTQYKFLGSYTLPWEIQVAGTFQNSPGNGRAANYVALNSVIAPSLKRNLATGPNGFATINVLQPGAEFGDRFTQIDLRFAKLFRVGRTRIKGMVDLYNALNDNTVVTWNNTYGTNGANWLVPQAILAGRLAKFGFQLDF